jgi:aminomethyltransferase
VAELKRTPLYDYHVKAGARMVDYEGWEMPLLYQRSGGAGGGGAEVGGGGIIAEHLHTRSSASVFDVSHMGRLKFTGKGAFDFLQRVCTRNLSTAAPGQSMYSLVCNDNGGILDDVIVSRFDKHWYMVCNAGNREKLLAWLESYSRQCTGPGLDIEDETMKTAMVAIQGPKAIGMLDEILPEPPSQLRRYHFEVQRYMMMIQFTVFRSGYTGEDGVEIICGTTAANMAVGYLLKGDKDHEVLKPAGLGARDTLRLEAGMPLYGHELSEEIDPLSAGLGWAVDLNKDFVGAKAITGKMQAGLARKLVGLFVDGPRAARQGMTVVKEGRPVGVVTSGAMSPTLKRCIAMAYVDAELAAPGQTLAVDVRGTESPANVTTLPFYKRPK